MEVEILSPVNKEQFGDEGSKTLPISNSLLEILPLIIHWDVCKVLNAWFSTVAEFN